MNKSYNWLVFLGFLILAALAFNGPLDMAYSNGEPPRGVRIFNGFVNGLSGVAGPKTFFYLVVLSWGLWAWKTFRLDNGKSDNTREIKSEKPPSGSNISDKDRQLVQDMMDGLVAQIEHGRTLEDLQADQSYHVQLRPQLPVRDGATSWFGGLPSMPDGMQWPMGADQYPMKFIAQIDLSRIPMDLWEGLGPRNGWLLLFSEYDNGGISVIHSPEFGQVREQPQIPQNRTSKYAHWFYHGPDVYDDLPSTPREHPKWPLDIVPVASGTNTKDWGYGYAWSSDEYPDPKTQLYKAGFDLLSPELAPFDWGTLWCLVRASRTPIKFGLKRAEDTIKYAPGRAKKLRQERPDGFEAQLKMNEDALKNAQDRLNSLSQVLQEIEALETEITSAKVTTAFSETNRDDFLNRLRQLDMPGCNTNNPEDPGRLSFHAPPSSGGWHGQYVDLFLNYTKHLYATQPNSLPPDVAGLVERHLSYHCKPEFGVSGHHPVGYVHEYDERTDITLLQLPTSGLMDWMWGDMYSLVLTIKKSDLQNADFSGVLFQISN